MITTYSFDKNPVQSKIYVPNTKYMGIIIIRMIFSSVITHNYAFVDHKLTSIYEIIFIIYIIVQCIITKFKSIPTQTCIIIN